MNASDDAARARYIFIINLLSLHARGTEFSTRFRFLLREEKKNHDIDTYLSIFSFLRLRPLPSYLDESGFVRDSARVGVEL